LLKKNHDNHVAQKAKTAQTTKGKTGSK